MMDRGVVNVGIVWANSRAMRHMDINYMASTSACLQNANAAQTKGIGHIHDQDVVVWCNVMQRNAFGRKAYL